MKVLIDQLSETSRKMQSNRRTCQKSRAHGQVMSAVEACSFFEHGTDEVNVTTCGPTNNGHCDINLELLCQQLSERQLPKIRACEPSVSSLDLKILSGPCRLGSPVSK